jgi:predicted dehydrogenase
MAAQRFRVGIVGLQPPRSWAARAHVPALASLPGHFEIAGVANSSRASAEAAAAACGIRRAFGSVAELVESPDVDIVAVTVKVPHHLALVRAASMPGISPR